MPRQHPDTEQLSSTYEPEDILRDLLYLRKGAGFTVSRFKRVRALRAVLGGDSEPDEVLRERLLSAIQSLGEPDAELLTSVYGFDAATRGLSGLASRRDAISYKLGVGRDAVADRDAAAVIRLRYQLITGWYPKSPLSIRIPESHNGTVQHFVRVMTIVRDCRHIESRHHYRFFCTFDGAAYTALTTAPGVTLSAEGHEFKLETEQTESGMLHRFWHNRPMGRGQIYDLFFRIVNPDPDEPSWITEESLAFHEPTRHAVFSVVFAGRLPALIWQFTGLTAHERPGSPMARNRMTIEPSSTVTSRFHDLYGGLYSGIAWEW